MIANLDLFAEPDRSYDGGMLTSFLMMTLLTQLVGIEGQVLIAGNRGPVRFARVELLRSTIPVDQQYTNFDGRFRFGFLPPGQYTVVVEYQGYDRAAQDVDVMTQSELVMIELRAPRTSSQRLAPTVSVDEYLTPKNVQKELDRARKEMKRKRWVKAEEFTRRAIEMAPDDGDSYHVLAVVLFEEGRFDDAEAMALKANERPHRIADVHLLLAKLYLRKGNSAALRGQLESYLREAPNGPISDRIRQALNPRTDQPAPRR
jgi:tetratricopeptide (TPR) repeat protein